MEIKKYINIIIKRLWLVITLPIVAGAISLYINFMVLVPLYQADTTLLVTGLSSENISTAGNMSFEDIIAGQSLISEYSEIIRSKRVTSAVVKDLNNSNITEADLENMVQISSVNDTRIIDISVINPDPAEAAKIADSVAKVFSNEIVKLYNIENVNIIDKAEVPENSVSPTKKKNFAISVIAAFIFAVSIVFIIEFFDNTIKTSEDVEKYLNLSVIGTIPVNSQK